MDYRAAGRADLEPLADSLSAGGPIVHPSVQSLLLTAISPRSLSFRTVLLPSDVNVRLSVHPLLLSLSQRGPFS